MEWNRCKPGDRVVWSPNKDSAIDLEAAVASIRWAYILTLNVKNNNEITTTPFHEPGQQKD